MNTAYRNWRKDLDTACECEGFENAHDLESQLGKVSWKDFFRCGFSVESAVLAIIGPNLSVDRLFEEVVYH